MCCQTMVASERCCVGSGECTSIIPRVRVSDSVWVGGWGREGRRGEESAHSIGGVTWPLLNGRAETLRERLLCVESKPGLSRLQGESR